MCEEKGDSTIFSCGSWGLYRDKESGDNYWSHDIYSISLWECCLVVDRKSPTLTENDIWKAYIAFQLKNIFKVCSICHEPEGIPELKICCYCGSTCHEECSVQAEKAQIEEKPANLFFEKNMCKCFSCEGIKVKPHKNIAPHDFKEVLVRKAVQRMLTLTTLPEKSKSKLMEIRKNIENRGFEKESDMVAVKEICRDFFQTPTSLGLVQKEKIVSKGGGVGIVAKKDIPPFTVIGHYPGYEDFLGGEQLKLGRPETKYSLLNLNCADYFNSVFPEFNDLFTPFINEPSPSEESNCGWIDEPHYSDKSLSIITVREIKAGEELLIGYGPSYPRSYEYRYDAYAFHVVENTSDPICFSFWKWTSKNEDDWSFEGYIAYCPETRTYIPWTAAES